MKFKKILALILAINLFSTMIGCSKSTTTDDVNLVDTTNDVNIATETDSTNKYSSPVVTTGQTNTYDADGNIISVSNGNAFYGQDGNYKSLNFSFSNTGDGITIDNNTGLMWEMIPLGGKLTWEDAVEYCDNLELGGYDDWRIPTVEELFSISDFSQGWPFLDMEYFSFDDSGDSIANMGGASQGGGPQGGSPQGSNPGDEPQGGGGGMPGGPQSMGEGEMPQGERPAMGEGEMPQGERPAMGEGEMPQGEPPAMGEGEMPQGERPAMGEGEMPQGEPPVMGEGEMPENNSGGASKDDGQYWTASYNMVEGDERLGDIAFGVNHTTGHIKAYPANSAPIMGKFVRAVRGDVYGAEDYSNNGDGTITDNASGLMWLEVDLGVAVEWEEALSLAENHEFAGFDDWRLPDVKELQSIVDYGGSYPAINQDYFTCTQLEENENYYYWTSTSAYFSEQSPDYDSAWYVAFGYTSHGAGAVRFSPKYEGSNAKSEGEDNILNSVRLVRNLD